MTTATAMVIPIENSVLEGMMKQTHAERENWRKSDIRAVAKLNSRQLRSNILAILLIIALGTTLFQVNRDKLSFDEFVNNLANELLGAAVTFYALELIINVKKDREDLFHRASSNVNSVALQAIEDMKREGWHEDGTLRGVELFAANLAKVLLPGADLKGAYIVGSNLKGAWMTGIDLSGGFLNYSILDNALLRNANLQNTDFMHASLRSVDLTGANLQGARMIDVDLQNVILDENTILPNGERWNKDYDLSIFTEIQHDKWFNSKEWRLFGKGNVDDTDMG